MPAQTCADALRRGDEHRRVAVPPRVHLGRDVLTGHRAADVDDLTDRESGSVAEVEDVVLARLTRVQRQQVGVGQVGDVDVVAYAGPVRRGVVIPEDLDRPRDPAGRGRQRHLQYVRDQVRLGGVAFPVPLPALVLMRARHVEVAQADRAEAVHPRELAEAGVHGELGGAVGAGRPGRVGLLDRGALRFAVDRRGRGEDDPADAGFAHRLQPAPGCRPGCGTSTEPDSPPTRPPEIWPRSAGPHRCPPTARAPRRPAGCRG